MKKAFSLIIILLFIQSVKSQYHYYENISFESNTELIEIDTTQLNNVWQIGMPQKIFFDSAYSLPYAIITDTINPYPTKNYSSFEVKIYSEPSSCWGTGSLEFRHKFDFESGKDGGYIEIRYDDDTTWTNIIFDQDPYFGIYFYNFYEESDTITGGTPAFTGNSESWKYSNVYWIWFLGVKSFIHDSLTIRFTMKSDENQTNKEGWLIDNMHLDLMDCAGEITSYESNMNKSLVYPNPVKDKSVLKFENPQNITSRIEVFDMVGQKVKNYEIKTDRIYIRNCDFVGGIYSYKITQDEVIISTGKFIAK